MQACRLHFLSEPIQSTVKLSATDPFDPGKVFPALHAGKSSFFQHGPDRFRLVITVFHQQPAVLIQVSRCTLDKNLQSLQPIGMIRQRTDRLETQVPPVQMAVFRIDIRRIRDDHIEAFIPVLQCIEPASGRKAHSLPAFQQSQRIVRRHIQCLLRHIRRPYLHIRPRTGHRNRNGTRPRSHIHYPAAQRQTFQSQLDEQFRLRPRYQHIGTDSERQPIKFPPSCDIGNRLTPDPS